MERETNMPETTSSLFDALGDRDRGEAFLRQDYKAPACSQVLLRMLKHVGISASEWIIRVNISKAYGYQVLRGERIPGRDILLRTAIVLQLSPREAQQLLMAGGWGILYPRVRRDAAVIFALNHKMTILETEELLLSLPERSLFAREI